MGGLVQCRYNILYSVDGLSLAVVGRQRLSSEHTVRRWKGDYDKSYMLLSSLFFFTIFNAVNGPSYGCGVAGEILYLWKNDILAI